MRLRPTFSLIVPLLVALLFFAPGSYAQNPVTQFNQITLEEGLSDNTVYSIVQDTNGFLWFGTQDGLNRYDGYTISVYRHDPFDDNSVSNDNAGNLYADRAGNIWIGTWGGGLDKFNPQTGQFTNYTHNPNDPNSLSRDRVQTIFEDSAGTIWVGTAGGGLDKLNPQTGAFTHYKHNPNNPNSISNDRIWRVAEDQQGFLWIATSDGLNKFNPQTEQFTRYYSDAANPRSLSHSLIRTLHVNRAGTLWVGTEEGLNRFNPDTNDFEVFLNNPADPASLSDNIINAILEDNAGNLWIGTSGGGLNRYNPQSDTFSRYINDPLDPNSLSYNDIRSIHQDDSGIIWLATRGGGVNKFLPTTDKIAYFTSNPLNPNSLNNNDVRAIYEDDDGTLWIGTRGGGLNRYNPQNGQFTTYPIAETGANDEALTNDESLASGLSSEDINAIYKDSRGIFWLGMSGSGLTRFNPQTEQFIHYQSNPDDPATLSSDDVYTIYEDQQGNLWIGTKDGGLNKFNPDSGQFTRYQYDPENPNGLSNNDVYAILEDSQGNLLLGTYGGGLNKFNPQTGQFTIYQFDPEDPASLSDNNIYNIFQDWAGTIWVTTANGGLNKFNPQTGQFTRYTQSDGLASDVVYAIQQDDDGNLWLTTNKGLSKFNPATSTFVNYDASDGLERINYQQDSVFKTPSGELLFGGINGLIKFNPAEIQDNSHVPPIVLTGFKLLNKNVDFDQPLNQVDTIELSYADDVFSFEFTALDFANPAKNRYAYMLEGFDDDWIEAGNRNFATYTNIDPGRYTFRVKGSNNAGLWNEEGAAINIVITPPFWETWWFRAIVVLATVAVVLAIYKLRVKAIEAQRKSLEKEVKQRTTDLSEANRQLQELNTRLQDEVLLAQEIQQSLLPTPRPNWAGLDVVCYSRPAHEVGGDFYAYHAFGSHRFALFVGDVSGKGMPAALLMAVSVGSLQSIIDQAPEPEDLLTRLHQTLMPYNETTRQNCALCYVEFMPNPVNGTAGTLRVFNAGGITPLIRHADDGTVRWIDVIGLPLGVPLNNVPPGYHQQGAHLSLARGDMVVLVSDGVIEAQTNREMFGFNRLEQAVAAGPPDSAETMLNHLQSQVSSFLGKAEPLDDLTIVVLRV